MDFKITVFFEITRNTFQHLILLKYFTISSVKVIFVLLLFETNFLLGAIKLEKKKKTYKETNLFLLCNDPPSGYEKQLDSGFA